MAEQDPRVAYKWRVYRSGTGEPASGIWAVAFDGPSELDWFVGVLGNFDLARAAVEGHNRILKDQHA